MGSWWDSGQMCENRIGNGPWEWGVLNGNGDSGQNEQDSGETGDSKIRQVIPK